MAVNSIWEARPANDGPAFEGIVGTFRTGEMRRRTPVTLDNFRVTTDDPDVAETIEQMLGGTTSENDSDKESLQVHTEAASIDVVYESIDSGFVVFAGNAFVRSCNGSVQTGGDDAGQPCPCADLDLEGRKAFATKGGCKPNIRVLFRLADAGNLGTFQFRSGSWGLLQDIQKVESAVDRARDEDAPKLHGTIAIEAITTAAGRSLKMPRVKIKR